MTKIQGFFGKTDEFLEAQFAQALGASHAKSVQESYSELIDYTRKLNFSDSRLSVSKEKWLSIFGNASVHLGLENLRKLSAVEDKREHLTACRNEIDSSKFIATLKSYSDIDFASAGLGLKVSPEEWLKSNDVPLTTEPDPQEFKNRIFAAAGFQPDVDSQYVFTKSGGGFFMMALHLTPKFCIGYGPTNSLFGLSTLAHEIGHTISPRERDLTKKFVEFPETARDDLVLSNEDDSYLYEFIFMQNAPELLENFGLQSDTEMKDRLFQRKAIQNNLHLLKNRMNDSYFSGTALDEISDSFQDQMRAIFPVYKPLSEFDWVKYATLDQPLSRVGYLEAYPKTFGKR
jgi:hypothetical protein